MPKTHISSLDFDVMLGDLLVHVESMSASITDNRQAVFTRGVPDGEVSGDVACSGDIEIDENNFKLIIEAARSAGSFRELKPLDIIANAKTLDQDKKIELFGCLLKVSDILSIDAKGAEKTKNKISFEVTSKDFVRINGVPYLSTRDTRDL